VANLSEKLETIIGNLTKAKADAAMIDSGQAGNPGKRLRATCIETAKTLTAMRMEVLEARGPKTTAEKTDA
jgi:hypothetical protein